MSKDFDQAIIPLALLLATRSISAAFSLKIEIQPGDGDSVLGLRRCAALVLLAGASLFPLVPGSDVESSKRSSNRLSDSISLSPLMRPDVIQKVRLIVDILLQHFISPIQRLARRLGLLLQLSQL